MQASLSQQECARKRPCAFAGTTCGWPKVAIVLLLLVCSVGCVRRRLTVRTNPPGAVVFVDNQKIGVSPCSVDFTYYGTREIRMAKQGYETLTINQPIPTPWYETPGLDFVSENLVPAKIRDNRVVDYNLAPQRIIPTEELVGRGQQLRIEANAQPTVPAGATLPAGNPANFDPFVGPPVNSTFDPSRPFLAPPQSGGPVNGPINGPVPTTPLPAFPPSVGTGAPLGASPVSQPGNGDFFGTPSAIPATGINAVPASTANPASPYRY